MKISERADYSKGVHAVLNILDLNQVPYQIREFDVPAHHASQAAELLDCPLGAVVKSLVFQKIETESMVLVLVSGKNRVNIQTLTDIVGQPACPANPEAVLNFTGYPVGSVPPIGMKGDFPVVMDIDLFSFKNVWAAAGSARILVRIRPIDLEQLSGGQVEKIN